MFISFSRKIPFFPILSNFLLFVVENFAVDISIRRFSNVLYLALFVDVSVSNKLLF